MIEIRRAADRYVTTQPGITSYHCFAAGPHYDPDNVSFGPVVGVDEHLVEPGAGFDWHAHRRVTIASWVLDGTLRHQDETGERLVGPGELFVQAAADGIRHRETNASDSEALRFVQTTLVGDDASVQVATRSTQVCGHAFVAAGVWRVGAVPLEPGDSIRCDEPVRIDGSGELLLIRDSSRTRRTSPRPDPTSG